MYIMPVRSTRVGRFLISTHCVESEGRRSYSTAVYDTTDGVGQISVRPFLRKKDAIACHRDTVAEYKSQREAA